MRYTIQNQWMEDSSVPYSDGAKKIFLYTKGTEGNPSQELQDMLKYIETTTEENVTNKDIETIHQLVEKVKRRKEVGICYMKSWELEQIYRSEAKEEGLTEGRKEGLAEGLEQGREEGRTETAKKMKDKGIDFNIIAECTGLTILAVQAL